MGVLPAATRGLGRPGDKGEKQYDSDHRYEQLP